MLTDFSKASCHALDYARSFFSDTVADFHLLCVPPAATCMAAYNPTYCHTASRTAYADQLNDILTRLRRQAMTAWHTYRSAACPGTWLDVIEKSLAMEPYDFVVMGSQQDGTATLFGHSAVALIRQLKANVIVTPVDSMANDIRRVVLATDFDRLKNAKLLVPVKELVMLKGADLTLLTIDVPDRNAIRAEQELHIREFLAPVEPVLSHFNATKDREGIDAYLTKRQINLLVTIPAVKYDTGTRTWESRTHTPPVPMLTLYDDGPNDQPRRIGNRTNACHNTHLWI